MTSTTHADNLTKTITEFGHKARCRHSWSKADRIARALRLELGPAFHKLDIEYGHIKLGESHDMFNTELAMLLEKVAVLRK